MPLDKPVNLTSREAAGRKGRAKMQHVKHDVGISKNLGKYSDAVETKAGLRWLYTAGTPGMTASGEAPAGIEAQTRLVWANLQQVLERAGMTLADLVKVTTSLTNAADIATYARVRAEILGDVRAAFMLQVVTQLVRPDLLVEVEIVAAAP